MVGVAGRLGRCEERECIGCGGRDGEEAVSGGAGREGHLRQRSEDGSGIWREEKSQELDMRLADDGNLAPNIPLIYTSHNVEDCCH